jgi:hypothetical protein
VQAEENGEREELNHNAVLDASIQVPIGVEDQAIAHQLNQSKQTAMLQTAYNAKVTM